MGVKLLTEGSSDELVIGASITNEEDKIALVKIEKITNCIILGKVYKDGDLASHEDFVK